MGKLLAIVLPLYALDQLTKWLVLENLERSLSREVIPGFFNLVFVTNTGAAFGSFKEQNLFFIVLSIATAAVLIVLFVRGVFHQKWSLIALALLLAGIFGNLTDRLLHGYVIDFLDFYIGSMHWPAFNVADSCICVAAAIFIFQSLTEKKVRE